MNALLAIETLLLCGLVVLVAGLLRSHGEILSYLAELEGGPELSPDHRSSLSIADELPLRDTDSNGGIIHAVAGNTLNGDAAAFDLKGSEPTLLAFFSTGCGTCERLIKEMTMPTASKLMLEMRVIVIFKDPGQENAGKLLDIVPEGVNHVMSSDAWLSYDVPGSPYFVYIDGFSGMVQSEGSTLSWDRVWSMIEDATQATRAPDSGSSQGTRGVELSLSDQTGSKTYGESTKDRFERAEDALKAAGVKPGDASLWPGSSDGENTDTAIGTQ